MKQQLSAQKWIEKFVLKQVVVSDAEIHEFYLANKQQFVQPGRIRARHILIKLKPEASNADRDAALKRLAEMRKKVDSGSDFEALARENSEDSSASKGGDLGYFQRGQMVKPFEQAAFDLVEPGDVSEIVETRFGLHLIQLIDKKPSVEVEEADASEQIKFYLWQQGYQRAVEEAVENLKEQAVIEKRN